MRIKRDNTSAILIDFQERLYPFIHDNEKLTRNVVRLIKGLNVLGVKMIVTEQYSKGLGHTIPEIQEAIGNYEHIEKGTFSCCGSSEVCDSLSNSGKKNIIISGIESHVCVLQTTVDLIAMGYLQEV
jgi:nicotinamidase-related amidase